MQEKMAIEEMFKDLPELQKVFKGYETKLKRYNYYCWSEVTTKERLEKKRDELLTVVKKLDNIDLLLLYYVKHIDGLDAHLLMRRLRKLYIAQCELKNELHKTEEYVDILEIGRVICRKGGKIT